jgi:hypothetical protein
LIASAALVPPVGAAIALPAKPTATALKAAAAATVKLILLITVLLGEVLGNALLRHQEPERGERSSVVPSLKFR